MLGLLELEAERSSSRDCRGGAPAARGRRQCERERGETEERDAGTIERDRRPVNGGRCEEKSRGDSHWLPREEVAGREQGRAERDELELGDAAGRDAESGEHE